MKLTEKQKRRLAKHHAQKELEANRGDKLYVRPSIWDTVFWKNRKARIAKRVAAVETIAKKRAEERRKARAKAQTA